MIWHRFTRTVLPGLILGTSVLITLGSVLPQSVTLSWNPSPGNDIVGYRVYQGVASQTYTSVLDAGNATTATLTGLVVGVTYFFAVTAYTIDGLESPFSGEISYTPVFPIRPRLQLAMNSAKQPLLTGIGPPGFQYAVEATRDFLTWTVIGTVTMDATGSFQFIDPAGATGSIRAYRLRLIQVRLQLAINSAKQPLLTGNGPAGFQYAVEATRNFATWTVIGNVTLDATGSFQFIDPAGAIGGGRAYRLRQTSPAAASMP